MLRIQYINIHFWQLLYFILVKDVPKVINASGNSTVYSIFLHFLTDLIKKQMVKCTVFINISP